MNPLKKNKLAPSNTVHSITEDSVDDSSLFSPEVKHDIVLEFETDRLVDEDFPNNKPGAKDGARWFTRSQPCLMFKDSSKYPDKFELNLSFSDSSSKQQSVSGFAPGRYILSPDAHGFDNRRRPTCDYTKLIPIT